LDKPRPQISRAASGRLNVTVNIINYGQHIILLLIIFLHKDEHMKRQKTKRETIAEGYFKIIKKVFVIEIVDNRGVSSSGMFRVHLVWDDEE
jgi:hypothetical protein